MQIKNIIIEEKSKVGLQNIQSEQNKSEQNKNAQKCKDLFSIGEIEELSGVKAHILRYWEQSIPSIAPQKTFGGHREYSMQDLERILRLKFLIYEKKFTIEGARNQIILESKEKSYANDTLKKIRTIRTELSSLFLLARKYRTRKS